MSMMISPARCVFRMVVLGIALSIVGTAASRAQESDRTAVMVEALLKLQNADLSSNARLKEAVGRLLEQVRGKPDFVRLVRKFDLKDQTPGLLETAGRLGNTEAGIDAARLLLAAGEIGALRAALTDTNAASVLQLMKALAGAGDGRTVSLFKLAMADPRLHVDVRKEAVRGAARTREGAAAVLALAAAEALPNDLRFVAQTELSGVRWPEIKAAAEKVLPPPASSGSEPLPPVSQLMTRTGTVSLGRELFFSKAACSTCHQVGGQGVNFGPDLSQIGAKLGKDALYEAILDPSSGISFGYEGWLIVFKSEDEVLGLIASETESEIAIRAPGGVVTSYRKSDIIRREPQKLSVMPAGLQATMSTEELVDLVEYLTSLKR